MPRLLFLLLLLAPLTIFGSALGFPSWLQFFLALGTVIPLAAAISTATEQVALTRGPRIGGILNATFGNVPELFVGYHSVQAGLFDFVKATLLGAIISNTAFVLGLAFIVGGLTHGLLHFDSREAGRHTVLLVLAIGGLLFPSIIAHTTALHQQIEEISLGVSVILLIAYLAFLAFSVFGFIGGGGARPAGRPSPSVSAPVIHAEGPPRWPLTWSIALLLGAAALLAPITDVLVNSVTPTVRLFGWSELFVGMILVANAGNAAALYAAIAMARAGRISLVLGIASGASIQIAILIAPLIVLISIFIQPMDLKFNLLPLTILGLVTAVFALIAQDGETNWLEGFQLLAIYIMAAAVFFIVPG